VSQNGLSLKMVRAILFAGLYFCWLQMENKKPCDLEEKNETMAI